VAVDEGKHELFVKAVILRTSHDAVDQVNKDREGGNIERSRIGPFDSSANDSGLDVHHR
jgi:hypothetical protein